MKKIVAVALFLCISGLMLFAADIMATTTDGKTVVLHDNGKWEYYKAPTTSGKPSDGPEGTWSFPEDYFDVLIDQALAASGISASDPSYAMYKQMIASAMIEASGATGSDVSSVLMSMFSLKFEGDSLLMTTE